MKKIEKSIVYFCLLFLAFLLLLLAGCQAQVVEVEVTRVVTETETVVEEIVVEVEKEVEVVKEVEVEKEVEAGSRGVGASGSEEEDPNPHTPKTGKVAANQEVADRMAWIQQTDLVTNPADVRILAGSMDDVIVYMESEEEEKFNELIMTNQIKRFSQATSFDPPNNLFLITKKTEWLAIADDVDRLLQEGPPTYSSCTDCADPTKNERYIILAEGQLVIIDVHPDQSIEELDEFLNLMRNYMQESREYAEEIWELSGPQ